MRTAPTCGTLQHPPAAKLHRRHRRRRHWPDGGSCITAAYRAAPVIVADIAVDPLWAAYRHLPLAHGLRASWSAPILSAAGQVLGTFALYSREPRSPRPQDLEVLEQIAAVAAVAIQHQRAHERFRHEEQELRQIVDAIPQTIVVLGPDGRTLYANQTALAYTGLTLDEVMATDFRTRVFHPDDVARLHEERQQALARGLPFQLEQRPRRHDGQFAGASTYTTRCGMIKDTSCAGM